jgi:hypothetical protein
MFVLKLTEEAMSLLSGIIAFSGRLFEDKVEPTTDVLLVLFDEAKGLDRGFIFINGF